MPRRRWSPASRGARAGFPSSRRPPPRSRHCGGPVRGASRWSARPGSTRSSTKLGRRYYRSADFEVVRSGPCDLPSDQSRITPSDLYDQVCRHTPDDADAVVIGGNGLRAVGAIAALEQTLERPVLTANQALLWAALTAAGADTSAVAGYGRIFGAATATA